MTTPHTDGLPQENRLAATEAAEPAPESIVEVVARAICESDGGVWTLDDCLHEDYRASARAAIAAMQGQDSATAAVQRVEALAEEVAAGHWDWCCAKGCAYPEAQHPDPTDPIDIRELVGIFGENPPPMRQHRTIPCPGRCNCPAGEEAARIRAALRGESQ